MSDPTFRLNTSPVCCVFIDDVAAEELALAIESRKDARRTETFEAVMEAHQPMVVDTAYRLVGRMEGARDVPRSPFRSFPPRSTRRHAGRAPRLIRNTLSTSNVNGTADAMILIITAKVLE